MARWAIVLPDGIFGNDTFAFIRNWIKNQGRILGIIDLPIETFQPNTSAKTSVLIFQKLSKEKIPENYEIFMAIAETCGHDRRGNEISEDYIKNISKEYKEWELKIMESEKN
ncbi:N-6 DNA methylase [Spiroplasma citri]|uniref:N-6 DNA methylase n=1 Tax=Spiroplasma citri TaxID=2133 RepID=UPI002412B1A2|nr:N-6 DNA methylase [Spiroplasma citri]